MTLTHGRSTGWRPLGGFDPKLYKRDVPRNSDFRKFDDGLKMTIDVDAECCRTDRDPAERGGAGRRLHATACTARARR